MIKIRSYKELIRLQTFKERFDYLKYDGIIGCITFGGHRYLNQVFYKSKEWNTVRNEIIARDNGFDLAHEDYPIFGRIYIHHINPITIEDILERNDDIFDQNNLISVSFQTHNAIHYGSKDFASEKLVVRRPNDTCPWKE